MNIRIMTSRFRRIISYHNIHALPHLSSSCYWSLLEQQTNRNFMQQITKEDGNVNSVFTFYINIKQKCVVSGFRLSVISSPFCDVTQPTMAGTEVSGQPVGPILKGHAISLSWSA